MSMSSQVPNSGEAFAELGLPPHATAAEIKTARRRLAQEHHPDLGGDPTRMKAVNQAAATALRSLEHSDLVSSGDRRSDPSAVKLTDDWHGRTRDVASFVVEALPVETFEGLLISAAWMGEVVDDDPPYRLETILGYPICCWCRLEVVPEAGSSTVSLTVDSVDGHSGVGGPPNVEDVRDLWVDTLNQIDWG
jgi:hypothetical protein